jgi:hypothetical protein
VASKAQHTHRSLAEFARSVSEAKRGERQGGSCLKGTNKRFEFVAVGFGLAGGAFHMLLFFLLASSQVSRRGWRTGLLDENAAAPRGPGLWSRKCPKPIPQVRHCATLGLMRAPLKRNRHVPKQAGTMCEIGINQLEHIPSILKTYQDMHSAVSNIHALFIQQQY